MKFWLIAGALIGSLLAAPALADVKAGVDAWSKGDYATAIREWEGPAARGDADAQFNLAQAYKLGLGVKQDLAKATELFGRATDQGHMQASDMYGLLLFQLGERQRALPFIRASADRGEPRAQYLLGISHFNGENVPKDWVRAYALVSLAQQAGIEPARTALQQMDQHIPIEQRQQAVALAAELSSQAEATRARQLASVDLGATVKGGAPAPTPALRTPPSQPRPGISPAPGQAVEAATRIASGSSPRTAGADYTVSSPPAAAVASTSTSAPTAPRAVPIPPVPRPAASAGGTWRIQLGAFGVKANAEALWAKLKSRPEIAGHARALVAAGTVTKLQATGYSQDEARAACTKLKAAGFTCLAVSN